MSARKTGEHVLRQLPSVDYYIPGDDIHHRQSPSPMRDRSSSARRDRTSVSPASAALPSLAHKLRQPKLDYVIAEEGEDADDAELSDATGQNGGEEDGDDGGEEGEQVQGETVESQEEEGQLRRSTRRGGAHSLAHSAPQVSSRAARRRQLPDQNGQHEAGEESAAAASTEEENDQPEGTPARRRPGRRRVQQSPSPLRAMAQAVPSSISNIVSASKRRLRQHHGEGETVGSAVRKESVDESGSARASLSLPMLSLLAAVALLLLLASTFLLRLLALQQPNALGAASVPSSLSSSELAALRQELVHATVYARDKEQLTHRQTALDDVVRRLEQALHKGQTDGHEQLEELRQDVKQRMLDGLSGLQQQLTASIQDLAVSHAEEHMTSAAEVDALLQRLRAEVEQSVQSAVQDGSDRVMLLLRKEMDQRGTAQGDSGAAASAAEQAALRASIADQLAETEQRALQRMLDTADSRYISPAQLQQTDAALRRHFHDSLLQISSSDHAAVVGEAELEAAEQRVLQAVERRLEAAEPPRLRSDERRDLEADLLQAVRDQLKAERAADVQRVKEELEEKLGQLMHVLVDRVGDHRPEDRNELRRYIDQQVQAAVQAQAHSSPSPPSADAASLSPQVASAVQDEIAEALELYSADRTGQVDYALKSSGGRIVVASATHRALPPSTTTSALLSLISRPWVPTKLPAAMLEPDMTVGSCWPMDGASGSVLIGLRERIAVTAISLQHVSADIVSAAGVGAMPRAVAFTGVEDWEVEAVMSEVEAGAGSGSGSSGTALLGRFEYRRDGRQLQQWAVGAAGGGREGAGFQYVRLDVLSNYGNDNYTCVYRVRVHGRPVREEQ